MEHWRDRPMVVGVPGDDQPVLYRLTYSDSPSPEDFRPDNEIRQRGWTEDYCSYRAFSAWLEEEDARQHALDINEARQGPDPPFTHIVPFRLWPKKRHACAMLPPVKGHVAVWAAPEEFMSRLGTALPILA